jgi:hypothetical protein
MPISITQNNNTVKITQDNPVITVTDNNKGTSVDVTQVDITTVSVATPGPKGDKGDNALTAADDLAIQDLTVRHITASGNISSSGTIIAEQLTTSDDLTVGSSGNGKINVGSIGTIDGDSTTVFNIQTLGILDLEADTDNNNAGLLDRIRFNIGGSEIARISGSGKIGIGTTTPGHKLHVNASTSDNVAKFESTDTIARIETKDDDDSAYFGTQNNKAFMGMDGNATSGNNITVDASGNTNIGGHITASGEISSSSKIYATQFQAESSFRLNDSGGTHRHVLRSAVTGNEIELGNSNFSGIEITGHVSASGDVTASGNIYSANFDSIPLSFQASGDGANWHGPNKQGPYYYVYNFNYGDNTDVTSLAREYVVAGVIMPYKCELVGFQAVVSNIASEDAVRIALYQGVGSAATFNVTSGTADALTLEVLAVETSLTPGAAENPMKITKLNVNKQLAQGDLIYPRIICGSSGANVSMNILIRRRP